VQVLETYWQKPVCVRLEDGREHTFLCVQDSLDCLEREWPRRAGRHQALAISLCQAALSRECSTEAAREAFIAACIEAGMHPVYVVRRPPPSQTLVTALQ